MKNLTATRIAALALLFAGVPGCSKAPADSSKARREDSIPVRTAQVQLVPMDRTIPVVGTLFAKDEAVIAAQVEGQVERTLVDFGDRVQQDQELALIDTTSYEALANQAAANVAKAQATLQNAANNLKRVQSLQDQKISSASELDAATAQADQAKAEVRAAESAAAIAQLNLRRSRVRAPFPAGVVERVASAGDYVKIGAPLYKLANDTVLKYIVQAPERYAAQVRKEQLVQFSVDAWPGEAFEGKVYLISPAVTTATRSFNLGALVPNPQGKLKANTFARGELVLAKGVETPVVPVEAVQNFAGVTKVFVIENGVARARTVQAGRVVEGRQEMLEGVKPGELVAVTGTSKLYENAKIRVQQPETQAAQR